MQIKFFVQWSFTLLEARFWKVWNHTKGPRSSWAHGFSHPARPNLFNQFIRVFSYAVNWKYIERYRRYTDILRWVILGWTEWWYKKISDILWDRTVQCNTDISFITWALELYLCISFIVTCFFRRFALRVSPKKENHF